MERDKLWDRLKIHTVPLVRNMRKGTEGLQNMRQENLAENEGVTIPVLVRWLSNPQTIRESTQRREIMTLSVVFVVRGKVVAQRIANKGVTAAGVRYKVEQYMNLGPIAFVSSGVDGGTSRANAAIIARNVATAPDCTHQRSTGALW